MGDPSYLRFVPAASANVPIDWTKVPEASKKFLLRGWGTDWSNPGTKRSLPTTIAELAKMVDESKFFGYMGTDLCTLILDISEFGLTPGKGQNWGLPIGPHFYMRYLSNVWFILFEPGQRDGVIGLSPDIKMRGFDDEVDEVEEDREDQGDEDEEAQEDEYRRAQEAEEAEEAARDKALAEVFEQKLCDELGRWGTLGAVARKEMAGWASYTMQSTLEDAQMATAMMGLPNNHPMFQAFFQNMFSCR